MDAAVPGSGLAQGVGRLGNWSNQELFGGPTRLPWGLRIAPQFRPARCANNTTVQPTFLDEMIWDIGLSGLWLLLSHRYRIRPPALFCRYVRLYCVIRCILELMRVDPATYILGKRWNFWVALLGVIGGRATFVYVPWRRPEQSPSPVIPKT
jgi:prolipoprotein diacylglyceryltransferase